MQNIQFFYNFEISKNGLQQCYSEIVQNSSEYGAATKFYIQMGVASITLLENAYKGVNFNFEQATLPFVQKLCNQLKTVQNQNDLLTYCQMLGAYIGWCAVKKHNAYFATIDNKYMLICNNKAYNVAAIAEICIKENKLEEIFNNFAENQ